MACIAENGNPVPLHRKDTAPIADLNISSLPLPLSPVTSTKKFLKKTSSLRKSLSSKKNSVNSMIRSEDNCTGVSVTEAVSEEMDMRSNSEGHTVQEVNNTTAERLDSSATVASPKVIPSHVIINEEINGSMDVDEYCEAGMTQAAENVDRDDSKVVTSVNTHGESIFADGNPSERAMSPGGEADIDVDGSNEDDLVGVTEATGTDTEEGKNDAMEEDEESDEQGSENSSEPAAEVPNVISPPESTGATPGTSSSSACDMDEDIPTKIHFGPPPIEIMITFDTTGSMSYYLDEVKNQINYVINRLFMDIPNLKIGLIAHGDYCDEKIYYLKQKMDLTNDINSLCEMVKNVEGTGGGDFAECYELILRDARLVKWTPGSQRALIMIGDACPHSTEQLKTEGLEEIDWKVEATALKNEMGVRVYGVQCQNHEEAGTFWDDLATVTAGQHLKLDKFSAIIDIIMAICYREGGDVYLQTYEKEVRAREGRMLATEVDQAFGLLRTNSATSSTPSTSAAPSRSEQIKEMMKAGASKNPKSKKPKTKKVSFATAAEKKKPKAAVISTAKAKVVGKANARGPLAAKRINNKKAEDKKKKVELKKHIREKVSEGQFVRNHPSLSWTPWIKVMTSSLNKESGLNRKRHSGIGYTFSDRINSLEKNSDKRSIYEIAVQVRPCCRRQIVHFHTTEGVQRQNGSWKDLVFTPKINKLVDGVLNQGTEVSVFVRRSLLKRNIKINGVRIDSASTCRRVMGHLYDYAWRNTGHRRTLIRLSPSRVVIQ